MTKPDTQRVMPFEPTRLMPFDPTRAGFGRHETFPMRYAWLPKGFSALEEAADAFESDDATIKLGVGKNMVSSIRFWLRVAGMVEQAGKRVVATELGRRLLGSNGWDPYLEDEGTLWLIHWLLATNSGLATTWWWFFNRFHKAEFTSQEVGHSIQDFTREHIPKPPSLNTVKQDVAVLLRMYSPPRATARTPIEESLDSPLSTLSLVDYASAGRRYSSRPASRDALPAEIVGFCLCDLLAASDSPSIAIEDLMYSRGGKSAPGSVFRLTESALLAKIERVVEAYPDSFELRETAGLHQVFALRAVEPLEFLHGYYAQSVQEEVA